MFASRRTVKGLTASLSRRLLLWIAGLFTGLVAVITVIQLSLIYTFEERSGARNIAYTLFSTRDVLANALWSFDPSQINASADLLHEHPLINAVFIESEDESLSQTRGERPEWPEQGRDFELGEYQDIRIDSAYFWTSRILRFRMSVEFQTVNQAYPVGEVIVYSSVAQILNNSRITLAFTLLSSVLLCLVLIAITALSVTYLVARRLTLMQSEMSQLDTESDIFKARLLPEWLTREGDEIAILAETLNRLQVRLAEKSSHVYQYQQTLQQQIQQRTRELEKTMAELRVSNAHKNEFLANMSHEIRTPMNGIIGMAELLQDSKLSDQQRDYLDTILASAQALTTIINDILDLSKIEAGRLELETIPFDLKDLVDSTLALFLKQADEKSLAIGVEIAPAVPATVMGDPTRLRQILLNLFSNAFKFTQSGEIMIEVYPVNDGDCLHFSVRDTGPGITENDQKNLFSAFSQAKTSTSRQYGGTGLGLAICKRLIELMKGELGVKSTPGEGSIFWFEISLPSWLRDGQSMHAGLNGITEAADLRALHGKHVLLVEDNKVNQKVAIGMLHRLGLSVTTAENGREALDRLGEMTPDLILMDCEMPVMDGYQATQSIRQTSFPVNQIPIVGLSAHAMLDHQQRALDAGMSDYLTKPLRRQALVAMLVRWLTNKKQ